MKKHRLGVNLRSNTYLGSASVDNAAKVLQQGMVADASHRSRRGSSVPRGFVHTFPRDFYVLFGMDLYCIINNFIERSLDV